MAFLLIKTELINQLEEKRIKMISFYIIKCFYFDNKIVRSKTNVSFGENANFEHFIINQISG